MFTVNKVVTIKLNSGEEVIAKVESVDSDSKVVTLSEPLSIGQGPKGMMWIPSLFSANPKGTHRLNTNSVALVADTDEDVRMKYIEATTGIKVPDKKIILG